MPTENSDNNGNKQIREGGTRLAPNLGKNRGTGDDNKALYYGIEALLGQRGYERPNKQRSSCTDGRVQEESEEDRG